MEKRFIYQSLFIICTLGSIICDDGEYTKQHFYYEGYGVASFSCNGSDVINITDVKLTNYPTLCCNNTCRLTRNDEKNIEMCNKNATCVIPIEKMSSCLKDKGFYNVQYSCQRVAMNCDFETSECGWNFSGNKWKIGVSQSGNHVMYVKTGDMDRTIESRKIARNNKQCLSFKYAVYYDVDSLKLYLKYKNGTTIKVTELKSEEYKWKTKELSITTTDEYRLLFVTDGTFWDSQYALDDIILENKDCGDLYEDLEQIPHNQTCNIVDETISLEGCYSEYLSLSTVSFDPTKDKCKDYLPVEAASVCRNSDVTYCNAEMVMKLNPSCLNLNRLTIEYTCAGTTQGHVGSLITNDSDTTGMVVGFIIGGLLIIGLICTVAFVIYRRRNGNQKGKTEKENNDLSASWHANGQEAYINSVQLSTKTVPPGRILANNLATNNSSYEQGYIISSVNKDKSEYMNMPQPTALKDRQAITTDYSVLNPKETGFNITNDNTYELASPTDGNSEDKYAESGAGVYDISGNSRHKVKDTIYDHTVDEAYDTANHGRQEYLGDYTYNHVFTKQTEDEYDIAGS